MDNTAQDSSGASTISLRVPESMLDEIEELVKRSNVGPNRVTRTSLILNWIERGLKESKRTR